MICNIIYDSSTISWLTFLFRPDRLDIIADFSLGVKYLGSEGEDVFAHEVQTPHLSMRWYNVCVFSDSLLS